MNKSTKWTDELPLYDRTLTVRVDHREYRVRAILKKGETTPDIEVLDACPDGETEDRVVCWTYERLQ